MRMRKKDGELYNTGLKQVPIAPQPLDRFASVLDIGSYRRLLATAENARSILAGRVVWNVSSTARGGGVAEMLISLLPLARGAGADVRWLVIGGDESFFRITKRIHNWLHGVNPDRGELGDRERSRYESVLAANAESLASVVGPRDLVILHDPQTAGLVPAVRRRGARAIWRCHIGVDTPNSLVRTAWAFLYPYLEPADAYVFSRAAHAWEGLPPAKIAIIPPSIDIFSPKNEPLDADQVAGILARAGIAEEGANGIEADFVRSNGTMGCVTRAAEFVRGNPIPRGARFITQISRWDRLKDPRGLVIAFSEHIAPQSDAHLVIAGPDAAAVADDPEGIEVLNELSRQWSALDEHVRRRVHLFCLPMFDIEENAAIVNALQRRASVVVQKSLAEGFGLTVAEAMWKARPIVASRVGGIQDQILNEVTGLDVDPTDFAGFGRAVLRLLGDPAWAAKLGEAAHRKCREDYLAPPHLMRYVRLFASLYAFPLPAGERPSPGARSGAT